MPTNYKDYFSGQVTLTDADNNYSLYDLLAAVDSSVSPMARELTIQGTTNTILVGHQGMDENTYGYALDSGNSRTYRSNAANVPVAAIYLRSATAGSTANVEVML